jgi:hypothetical protein
MLKRYQIKAIGKPLYKQSDQTNCAGKSSSQNITGEASEYGRKHEAL